MTTIPSGTTRRQLMNEWTDLLDIPYFQRRELTAQEIARRDEIDALLYPADQYPQSPP